MSVDEARLKPTPEVAGIGLTLLLHIAGILVVWLADAWLDFKSDYFSAPLYALLFIGLFQLVYMVPAGIIAAVKKKRRLLTGLVIGASVTFILNAVCFGVVMIAS